jgi:hypothetical protein
MPVRVLRAIARQTSIVALTVPTTAKPIASFATLPGTRREIPMVTS